MVEPSADEPHYLARELEELSRTSRDILDFLQRGTLDGLWYWDLERPEHEWMNAEFWRLLGYDPASKRHLASEWQDLIHPADLELAKANLARCIEHPTHRYDQEVRYRHADGSTVWVRCRGLLVRDAEGRPKRMLGAHNDITALKRAEAELQRRIEDLSEFVRVASHDLRAPLRAIETLSTWIEDDNDSPLSEASAGHLATLRGRIDRMGALLTDLVTYHRAGSRVGALEGTTDVHELLGSIGELLSTDLSLELDLDEVRTVPVPKEALSRVLRNLLNNSIKHSDLERPTARVSARSTPEGAVLDVTDDGPGIPAKYAERIFAPFQTLQSRDVVEGSGLGLSIARRTVEHWGGRLELVPGEGRGATFRLVIPPPEARPPARPDGWT